MGGIGGQRHMDVAAVELPVGRGAEVVFDVGRALDILGIGGIALEFREDGREGLADEIGQHVEPAAMGHAHHHLIDAELAAALQDLLQRRDRGLAAVQPEALGAGIFAVEEALEDLRRRQPLQYRELTLGGELGLVADRFDALLDPGLLGRVLDMHELDADLAAIGGAQLGQDLAERRGLEAHDIADEDRPVHIGLGEAIGLRVELGMGQDRLQAEGIEIGLQMAAHAIGADELQGPDRIRGRGAQRLDAGRACTGRCRFARHWGFRRRRGGAIGTPGDRGRHTAIGHDLGPGRRPAGTPADPPAPPRPLRPRRRNRRASPDPPIGDPWRSGRIARR